MAYRDFANKHIPRYIPPQTERIRIPTGPVKYRYRLGGIQEIYARGFWYYVRPYHYNSYAVYRPSDVTTYYSAEYTLDSSRMEPVYE